VCVCVLVSGPSRLGRVINDFIKLAHDHQARGHRAGRHTKCDMGEQRGRNNTRTLLLRQQDGQKDVVFLLNRENPKTIVHLTASANSPCSLCDGRSGSLCVGISRVKRRKAVRRKKIPLEVKQLVK